MTEVVEPMRSYGRPSNVNGPAFMRSVRSRHEQLAAESGKAILSTWTGAGGSNRLKLWATSCKVPSFSFILAGHLFPGRSAHHNDPTVTTQETADRLCARESWPVDFLNPVVSGLASADENFGFADGHAGARKYPLLGQQSGPRLVGGSLGFLNSSSFTTEDAVAQRRRDQTARAASPVVQSQGGESSNEVLVFCYDSAPAARRTRSLVKRECRSDRRSAIS